MTAQTCALPSVTILAAQLTILEVRKIDVNIKDQRQSPSFIRLTEPSEVHYQVKLYQNLNIYTVSQKKLPTFKLSVNSSNLNRFSKFLHCWKAYEICYKNA